MIKALIIEDETYIARDLKERVQEVDPSVKVVEILPSLKTTKKWLLQNEEPDLIFMDIQLGDGVSFEIFNHYTISCPVIFTTAFDEFALKAFKANGMDYLLKPINSSELKQAIDKCKIFIDSKKTHLQHFNYRTINTAGLGMVLPSYKENFIVNYRNHWIPVKTSDIAFFMKDKLNYVYKFNGEKYHLDFNTLEEVEEMIDPLQFYRANRQFIIHINAIKSIEPKENSKLKIYLKEDFDQFEIEVSREKAPLFKKWLNR
jgi:DNA-binding LytR/AlgR family response regulator